MKIIITSILLSMMVLMSCSSLKPIESKSAPSKLVQSADEEDDLLGLWVCKNASYGPGSNQYIKSKELAFDKGGIIFKTEGKLVIRHNYGWCASGPIMYTNTEGRWAYNSDSSLTIHYKNWSGPLKENWKINRLSKQSFSVVKAYIKGDTR